MTPEEKVKRYDEILDKVKDMLKHRVLPLILDESDFEHIFPELKESEDERIRKGLIDYIKSELNDVRHIAAQNHIEGGYEDEETRLKEYIAYLEKQSEQKSIWHNEDEEPQRGSLILLIMQSGIPIVAKIVEPNHTFNHGERWAYIDDLLEKQAIYVCHQNGYTAVENWLKSLRHQKQWKPNKEQMECLYKYAEQNNYDGTILTSLYDNLKKL